MIAGSLNSNPLEISLPYSFNLPNELPTEVMASRFQAWRVIIRDLANYLKEYASVEEEIVRQQARLQQAASQTMNTLVSVLHGIMHHNNSEDSSDLLLFLPAGNGSVQDISSVLASFHQKNVVNASKTIKEINLVLVPKLEELRSDLLVKIKEIKNLQNDFRTGLAKELLETKALLHAYIQALDYTRLGSAKKINSNSISIESGSDHHKRDPYLFKIKLGRQLKRQLSEEHYLHNAYINLQTSGAKLEAIVVLEIQSYLDMFLQTMSTEADSLFKFLAPTLRQGFLSKEENFEWDAFISRKLPNQSLATFIDLNVPLRRITDLSVPGFDLQLSIPIHQGWLERRSKYLKLYSTAWYVLTCGYLHEFKTDDRKRDQVPLMLLPLDGCTVLEHSKDDGKEHGLYKFILSVRLPSGGLMHRSHNWVFRTSSFSLMMKWYDDIKSMSNLPTPTARAKYLEKNRPEFTASLHPTISRASSVPLARPDHVSINSGRGTPRTTTLQITRKLIQNKKTPTSPKPAQMIHSDGTIITPMETYNRQQYHVLQGNLISRSTEGVHDVGGLLHPEFLMQASMKSPSPAPGVASNYTLLLQLIPTYLVSGNQHQQVYDPVQQQYFTLTLSAPPTALDGVSPQPQYAVMAPSPGPIAPINTGSYFALYAGAKKDSHNFGDALPYPAAASTDSVLYDIAQANPTAPVTTKTV